jgi:hypothetical protein
MAIDLTLTDLNPFTASGVTSKIDVGVLSRADLDAIIPKAFNLCAYQHTYVEQVFAEFGGSIVDEYKNDKSDFLFPLSLATDTVVLKMFKNNVEIATITDNTYGTYFAPSYFPDALKVGFLADWNTILDLEGVGTYKFEATRTIIGIVSVITSHDFRLRIFDEQLADGTIKVVTNQTGVIEGGIDYTGFTWVGHIRLNGFFGNPDYSYETDNFIDTNRNVQQIQDKIRTVYTMSLKLMPSSIIIPFIKDRLLANSMTITSYGLFDFLERYKEIPVYPEGIEESKYYERNNNGVFTIAFTDKQQTPIKRKYS